tara:strand:+ start:227 stop:769 length:543 start_codon:yes stop_codon:yes gene_type:complete
MTKEIIIGGGCFWCTEAIFQELEGIIEVKSGYSGGSIKNPAYREVCTGRTGHAEVVKISYDNEKISLLNLLIIHLTTHDPTTKDRQGADRGTQYRSVIYYADNTEKEIAEQAIVEVQSVYENPIVTEVSERVPFFLAEPEHQNYYKNNSEAGYCQAVINPKLNKFRKLYSTHLKAAELKD